MIKYISPRPFALLWIIRVALRFTLMMTSWFPRPGDGSSAHTLWTRDHSLSNLHPSRQGWKKLTHVFVNIDLSTCIFGWCLPKSAPKTDLRGGGVIGILFEPSADGPLSAGPRVKWSIRRQLLLWRFVESPLFLGGGSTSIWVIMFCSHVCTS